VHHSIECGHGILLGVKILINITRHQRDRFTVAAYSPLTYLSKKAMLRCIAKLKLLEML
jgi:hypothetical protein